MRRSASATLRHRLTNACFLLRYCARRDVRVRSILHSYGEPGVWSFKEFARAYTAGLKDLPRLKE
jgi:hypothetical protein